MVSRSLRTKFKNGQRLNLVPEYLLKILNLLLEYLNLDLLSSRVVPVLNLVPMRQVQYC
eukprot:SAG31_NODE_5398_length_2560_cov_2.708537_1_plen_58_part_10